jgi:hypothetical protein
MEASTAAWSFVGEGARDTAEQPLEGKLMCLIAGSPEDQERLTLELTARL